METAIEKADVLIEAMRWIRTYRGALSIIKMGGSVMEDTTAMTHLLLDIVFMETVGVMPVVVHGGGAAISQAMNDAGIVPRFIQGRRYTDEASLEIVKKVLGRDIANSLAEQISSLGGSAKVLSPAMGNNVLFGKKLLLNDEKGESVDMGLVGEVTRVDTAPILELCRQGIVPVIPSVAVVEDGENEDVADGDTPLPAGTGLNVNADTAAIAVARALRAEKLVFVSEVNGLRTDPNDPKSMIDSITAEKARELLASGAIVGGMIPKIQACLETLERGVKKVHIINGRLRHSLLLEIFTSHGVGTEIIES